MPYLSRSTIAIVEPMPLAWNLKAEERTALAVLLRMTAAFLLLALLLFLLSGCGDGAFGDGGKDAAAAPPAIRTFAELPVTPGQPGGIAVDGDTVYVDTFGFVVRPADGADNIYAFGLDDGALRADRTNPILIPRRLPVCVMGLSGMALDGQGRLYLVDMNARVLRLDPRTGAVSDYATFPAGAAGPVATMPLDIAFDAAGNAYVSDIGGAPVIWRIPPGGGQASVWFSDPRLAGFWSEGAGGLRLDPAGAKLYVSVVASGANGLRGTIYRVPLANPSAATLEKFHEFESMAEAPPLGTGPLGIAFGASGKLYVALPGTSQVSVLNPDGSEAQRYTFDYTPQFLALTDKRTLLVTAWGFPSGPWPVYEVAVDDLPGGLQRPDVP